MKKVYNMFFNGKYKEIGLYFVVGGLATVVEWTVFWILKEVFHIQYLMATGIAFIFSTFANWEFGRILVFKTPSEKNFLNEIISIYLASIIGLSLNLLVMVILVQIFKMNEMISKMTATILIFMYNYFVRKFLIYKTK